jgi:hypothetical protein
MTFNAREVANQCRGRVQMSDLTLLVVRDPAGSAFNAREVANQCRGRVRMSDLTLLVLRRQRRWRASASAANHQRKKSARTMRWYAMPMAP